MTYELLAIIGFLEGIFTGLLLRFETGSRILWLFNVSSMIGLLIMIMPSLANPSINGIYAFFNFMIPYVITTAFAAKGEEFFTLFSNKYN